MKTIVRTTLLAMALLLVNCNKDDDPLPVIMDETDPEPENRAPGTFTLLEVSDGATGVDLTPTFSWNISTDPDGDAVKYDVFLALGDEEEGLVASDLTTATFTLTEKLDMALGYEWRIVAKDGKGGETSSETFSFTSRSALVTSITPTAPFIMRSEHSSVVFQEKMWVIGGNSPNGLLSDVWSSPDGQVWTREGGGAFILLPKVRLHATTVYLNEVWLSGGRDVDNNALNASYSSTTGFTYTEESGSISPMSSHTLNEFQGKLWRIGGVNTMGRTSEIWHRTADTEWEEVVNTQGNLFRPRLGHDVVVFQDKLWLIGGSGGNGSNIFELNDVWHSEDGENWTQVLENAPFSERSNHKVVVFDDKMWLIGGNDNNEIWYSTDGLSWIDATPEESFTKALRFTSVVFNDKIWVLGGLTSEGTDVVWTIE